MTKVCIGNHETEVADPRFLVTNSRGDFLALGAQNVSTRDGFFVKTPTGYVKLLHNIDGEGQLRELDLRSNVFRRTDYSTQTFMLRNEGLLVETKGKQLVTLDCKKFFDESDVGRIYEVRLQAANKEAIQGSLASVSCIHVHYKKFSGSDCAQLLYDIYLCIATTLQVDMIQHWRQVQYPYDTRRGTFHTPYVFDLATLLGDGKIAICYAQSEQEAQRNAMSLLVMGKQKLRDIPTLSKDAKLAWQALAALQTNTGIMAGLPWFFQEWSRDELVACGGLLSAKQYEAILKILDKWYGAIRSDGQLPAIYPDQGLVSSDAPGWLGKRTKELLVHLSRDNMLHRVPTDTITRWRDLTARMLDAAPLQDGLVWSETNTTWMDTQWNDNGRAGARIEIQALYLTLYDCHAYLCTITKTPVEERRRELATFVQKTVHDRLMQGATCLDGLHADGSPDFTVRPNLFLAWYIKPDLFSRQEWRACFEFVLARLWLSWGGFASIATSDQNFHAQDTGENVAAYHRGDSWYFINNMAAMALYDVDKNAYKVHVSKIIGASCNDLLSQGLIGHCSEISSAEKQEAFGCHAQAWSASTLLEALLRVHG